MAVGRLNWRLGAALLLAAFLVGGLVLARLPAVLLIAYLLMGTVSMAAYGFDKRAAQSGQWRISEAALLGIDLLFGVAGGLLGQLLFRHKTRKASYVAKTLAISAMHLFWLGALATGLLDGPALLAQVTRGLSIGG